MEIAALFVRLAMDTAQYAEALTKTTQQTQGWASRLGGIVKAGLMAALAVGVTAFVSLGVAIGDSVGKAADLEAQLSAVASVSGATNEQVGQLKGLINDLGVDPNLKVSAFEAADAMEMLARNGLTVDQIMDGAARSTILLANATGADFSQAADIATDTMALFGIKAEEMDKAVDGITSVVNNSKFSIDDYALALAQGGGVAAATGVEFDDFNASIAAISPLFASGSDAGTSFKTFLQRLVPSTDKAEQAMKDLGLEFFDSNGNMKDMANIAGQLNKALGGLSEEQRNQALTTIFGTDAMRAAAGLAKLTEAEFRDLQKTMSQTSAAENAAKRMDNLSGALEIFWGVVEAVQLQIGEKFIPAVRAVVEAATNFISLNSETIVGFFGRIADGITMAIPFIVMLAGYLLDLGNQIVTQVVPAVLTFIDPLIQQMIPAFQQIGERIVNEVIPAVVSFAAMVIEQVVPGLVLLAGIAMQVATTVFPLLVMWWNFLIDHINIVIPILAVVAIAIAALTAPITLVIGAVLLLATAWANNWGDIQGKTKAVIDFLKPYIQAAMAFIQNTVTAVLAYVQEWWEQHGENVMLIARTAWEFIQSTIDSHLKAIQAVVIFVATAIRVWWAAWGETLIAVARTAWDSIKLIVKTAMEQIGNIIDAISALIRGDWEGFGNALKAIWNTAWEANKTILNNAKTALGSILQNLVDVTKTVWGAFGTALKDEWQKKWDAIKGILSSAKNSLASTVESLAEDIQTDWNEFTGNIEDYWNDTWEAMLDTVDDIGGDIEDMVGDIIDWVEDAIDALLDLISTQDEADTGDTGAASLSGSGGNPGGRGSPGGRSGGAVTIQNFTQNIYSNTGPGSAVGEFQQMKARYST